MRQRTPVLDAVLYLFVRIYFYAKGLRIWNTMVFIRLSICENYIDTARWVFLLLACPYINERLRLR